MALTTTITANPGATGNYVTVAGAPPQTVGLTLCMWIAMPFDAMQTIGNSTLDTPEIYLFRVTNAGWPRMDFACLGQRGATYPVFRMQVFSAGPDHDTGIQWPTNVTTHATNGSHNALTWMFAAYTWNATTGATIMYCAEVGGAITTVATETLGTAAEIGTTLNQIDICSLTDNSSFTGSIFGVKTFASILTPAQLLAESAAFAPVAAAWAHLPLNTGAGRLNDASGNGHNATAVGSLTDGADAPLAAGPQSVSVVGSGGVVFGGASTISWSPVVVVGSGGVVFGGAASVVGHVVGVAHETAGAPAYSAASGTSLAVPYPSGIVAGRKLVLLIGQKPSTANSGSVTTPSGWSLDGSLTGAGGYATTLGADTGNCNAFAYTKTADGSETGNLTVTVGTNSVSWGILLQESKRDSDSNWNIAVVSGSDTSAGNLSISYGSNPGIAVGDMCVAMFVSPTDVAAGAQFSAETLTATGATFGTVTELAEPRSGNGNDIGGLVCYARCTAGAASAAPVLAATAGSTTTNVRGPSLLIRIREAQVSAVTGSGGAVFGGAASVETVSGASTQDVSYSGTGGGVFGGASATNAIRVTTSIGGAVFGGLAAAAMVAVAVGSGGTVLGGAASVAQVATVAGSGGALLGGASQVTTAANLQGAGGTVLGGASGVIRAPTVTGSGGAVFGGSATIESTGVSVYAYAGTGGSLFGGSAVALQAATTSGSGGVVLGGSSQATATVLATATGGAVLGGSSIALQVAAVYGTSGAVLGGSGTVNQAAVLATSGGALFGGSASVDAQQNGSFAYVGSGGMVAGGTAAVGRVNQFASAGGVILGGASSVLTVASAMGSGGLVLGGTANEARAPVFVGSGGVVVGGSAHCVAIAELGSTGGVVFGGSATVGSNQLQNVAIVSLGGAVFGGIAAISIVLARPQDISTGVGLVGTGEFVTGDSRSSGFAATSSPRRVVTGISISSKKIV